MHRCPLPILHIHSHHRKCCKTTTRKGGGPFDIQLVANFQPNPKKHNGSQPQGQVAPVPRAPRKPLRSLVQRRASWVQVQRYQTSVPFPRWLTHLVLLSFGLVEKVPQIHPLWHREHALQQHLVVRARRLDCVFLDESNLQNCVFQLSSHPPATEKKHAKGVQMKGHIWIHHNHHPFWCKKCQPGKDLQVMKIAQDHHITGVKPPERNMHWQNVCLLVGALTAPQPPSAFPMNLFTHKCEDSSASHPKIHGVWSGEILQNDWYPKLKALKLASILDGERPNPGCSSQPPNGREPSCQVNRTPKTHVSVAPVPSPDSSNASENGWHAIWQFGGRELHCKEIEQKEPHRLIQKGWSYLSKTKPFPHLSPPSPSSNLQ